LHLKPFEFWSLTPADIEDMMLGYEYHREITQDWIGANIGWVLVHLIAPHAKGGKAPPIKKLIPKFEKRTKKKPVDLRNELHVVKERFKNG
jgi:hypothetical protein